jgi:hypothetical protein
MGLRCWVRMSHDALAQWCVSRKGFVQVCETAGASWLPSLWQYSQVTALPGFLSNGNRTTEVGPFDTCQAPAHFLQPTRSLALRAAE